MGGAQITGFEDDSNEARLITLNYDAAKRATLEAHVWTFAVERFIPAKVSTNPAWGYPSRFLIPGNILRVLSVGPNNEIWWQYEQDQWEVEGPYILTDVDVIYCRGIANIEEEGLFSGLFEHALSAKLAVLVALPLTKSRSIMETMAKLYAAMINDAKTRDGLQGRSRRIRHRSMRNARAGLSSIPDVSSR